ncbi:MAG: transporter ATP-binding protein [Bacteroidetes bacterium]|nr:transporter ATP-binding protein [Bacteroidota bacterium]
MIEINNLSFYYKKGKPVFEQVSFEMATGIYGLLGENGVGKSTLLRIISGLRFPHLGECKIDGTDTFRRAPDTLSKVFYLPEEFESPTIKINRFIKDNAKFYPNFSREQFEAYMSDFEMETDRKFSELSYGQKKKVLISYGMSLNTPYVLLDEPTNGLDIPSKAQFRKVIASAYDEDRCIIISTHQVRDLESLIDPIIILDRNQVLLNNSVEEITRKLIFKQTQTKPENAFYTESNLMGYSYVGLNATGEETTLNIEMLFNAAVANRTTFKELFNI